MHCIACGTQMAKDFNRLVYRCPNCKAEITKEELENNPYLTHRGMSLAETKLAIIKYRIQIAASHSFSCTCRYCKNVN